MKKNTIFMVLLVLALIFAFTAPALATEACLRSACLANNALLIPFASVPDIFSNA